MRNFLLILFLSLGLLNFSHAGGDDRDQQLPLNSLNSEQEINEEGVPRFLQEDDEVIQDDAVQQGQKEIEELIQTKLVNQETPTNTEELIESDVDSSSNTKDDNLPGYFEDFWTWDLFDEFTDFVHNSPTAQIASELMNASQVNLVMDNWFLREAGSRSCLLYTSPSPRDQRGSRMPSSA